VQVWDNLEVISGLSVGAQGRTGNLAVNGGATIANSLFWSNGSELRDDPFQGGAIELGESSAPSGPKGTPYIDFHFKGMKQDYNTRIINDDNGKLSIMAPKLAINGSARVQDTLWVKGGLNYWWGPDGAWKNIQNRAGEYAGSYTTGGPSFSDLRFKREVHSLPSALDKIRHLRGVTFRWNDEALRHFTRDIETTISAGPDATEAEHRKVWAAERDKRYKALANTNVGVVAQDVEAVLPEAVSVDQAGYKAVRYQSLIPLLVEAIKEQDGIVRQQARTVALQREEIEELRSTQRDMQAQLSRLRGAIEKLTALTTPQDRVSRPDSGRVSSVSITEQGALASGTDP
jgi:hypothetical protein